MKLTEIKIGTTVDIRYQQVAAKEDKSGELGETYRSDIFDILSDTEMEINIPLSKDKPVMLPEKIRYEIIFYADKGMFKSIGVVAGRYKKENFNVYKIELTRGLEKFQRREFFRFSCQIPVIFSVLEEEEAELDTMEELMEQRDTQTEAVRGMGTILDISGGGIRFSSTMDLSAYHFLLLQFELEREGKENDKLLLVALLMASELPKDGSKYINRVRILFKNSDYQEKIIRYIFEEERRLRKKGQE